MLPPIEFNSEPVCGSLHLPQTRMDLSAQKEQFSNAFLLSIAAVAGCSVSKPSVDNDSIDWTISNRLAKRPKLDVQLKCTATDDSMGMTMAYPLPAKNYADLILTDLIAPRILVLVIVPKEIRDWIQLSDEELVLRRCGYWVSLAAKPEPLNATSVTVHVPRENRITVESLSGLMEKISRGEAL
jgi:hypothetical protein